MGIDPQFVFPCTFATGEPLYHFRPWIISAITPNKPQKLTNATQVHKNISRSQVLFECESVTVTHVIKGIDRNNVEQKLQLRDLEIKQS